MINCERIASFYEAYLKFMEVDKVFSDSNELAHEFVPHPTDRYKSSTMVILDQEQHEICDAAGRKLVELSNAIWHTYGVHPQDVRYAGSLVRTLSEGARLPPNEWVKQHDLVQGIINEVMARNRDE